jgi:hypothetical protein
LRKRAITCIENGSLESFLDQRGCDGQGKQHEWGEEEWILVIGGKAGRKEYVKTET